MEKIRIRLEDGRFEWMPKVCQVMDGDDVSTYIWFRSDARQVYVMPRTAALGGCSASTLDEDELENAVGCSVEEFNSAVMAAVEKNYICHE